MKKAHIFSAMVIGSLCFASFASAAVVIPNPLNVTTFTELLLKIAGAVGALVGALGTIMLIVAGILFLLSAGRPEAITKAKTALIYAIAGIAIGLAATAIVETIQWVLK